MVKRDRHDITFEILRKARAGKRKTGLMQDVGLSYLQARYYLNFLMQNGLLELGEKHSYKTTKKGTEFLEKCEQCPLFKWRGKNDNSLVLKEAR
jgi:predicted transcriptional regulator